MVKGIDEAPSLQETVEAAFDEHVTDAPVETPPEVDVPHETLEATPDPVPETPPEIEATPKTNAAGRLIDDKGRFIKKIDEVLQTEEAPVVEEIPPEVIEAIAAPKSWKKEHHDAWLGFDPKVQEYIFQREEEYANGVSTYKSEYDQLKPLSDAIAPFMEDLQANNINPGQWVSGLGNAHMMLAKGSPEQKLSMFMKLAGDYNVPVQSLFAQGEDGKLYYNPQVQQHQEPQPDVNALVENKMAEVMSQQQIQQFAEVKDAAGNPAHPHYETVRETMAQLLESGLAEDLDSAYAAALRHPRHAEIFDSISLQDRESEEKAKAEEIRKETERARNNITSVKSATPTVTGGDSPKGRREAIEAAFELHENTSRI